MKNRLLVAFTVFALLLPSFAHPQALTSLASLRVRYNSQKASIQPQGELKQALDTVDAAIAEATRLGLSGELRRQFAKGSTLLAGREWTDTADFTASLVLRTDRVVVDPARPYQVRLEQIYRPDIELAQALRAQASLLRATAPAAPASNGESVKDFGAFDGVSRDLSESPYFFELDLSGVVDGNYQLTVEISEGMRILGSSQLAINVRNGLDALVARLEQDAANAPEALRADILYPVDRMRQINRGRLELRTFNPNLDFAAAETVLAAVNSGSDPFKGRSGDFKRHYLLESADEIMPYRLYIPTSYNATREFPLVIALHGLGGTENSFFENYNASFPELAEQHGYIVAAPLGYRVDGSYGWGLGNPPADPNTRIVQERSEEDVMQVLARVQQDYRVDSDRVYMAGHSMGAIGAWKLAPKYPQLWAAIGMYAGAGVPATLEGIRHIPQFVVHGDADPTVSVNGSRAMVARMRELEMTFEYVEVPGGNHSDVVAINFPGLFEFFNQHSR
jgi:poly(3-hydroxybutyrate) depolymerase